MSLSSTTDRVSYTGNGATSVYSYGCRIKAQTDLLVTKRLIASPYTETTLVLTTDYTVSGVGNSTGNITLVAGSLAATYKLFIRRVRPLTQSTIIRNDSAYYPSTIEDSFDHQIMIAQQLQDEVDRCIQLPETVAASVFNPGIPIGIVNAANKVLVVNSTGDGFDLMEATSIAAFVAQSSFSVTDGQAAADLTSMTGAGATYTSDVYQYEIIRGTTVLSTGSFSIHYRNGTWVIVLGEERYDNVSHGVTFSLSGTTTYQLRAALDVGAGNGTIKLKRHRFTA